jgi:hypothetical protein
VNAIGMAGGSLRLGGRQLLYYCAADMEELCKPHAVQLLCCPAACSLVLMQAQ